VFELEKHRNSFFKRSSIKNEESARDIDFEKDPVFRIRSSMMAFWIARLLGKCLKISASLTPAAAARSRLRVPLNPDLANASIAPRTMRFRRSSWVRCFIASYDTPAARPSFEN